MSLPAPVARYIEECHWGRVTASTPVGGGCINNGARLTTSNGPRLFLKTNATCPPDMFAREAEGLAALAAAGDGPRVPRPLLVGEQFLLLEYLAAAPPVADYWEVFGRALAQLHSVTHPQFGFQHDNYIGSTPQSNRWHTNGFTFFAEERLLYQGKLAREHGLLSQSSLPQLERMAGRLRDLVPEQPASLMHGDLWNGNAIEGPDGHACLIDPAAHYGWAEAELATTTLFGRFPPSFYSAYESTRLLAPEYRARFEIYNLYHLLNHLNLFGEGYAGAVEGILARYG
jgi:fructosamine-3-kinase